MENLREQSTQTKNPLLINREDLNLTPYDSTSNLLKEHITDINELVMQGNLLEAFEKYYDDAVIMQENEQQPTIGKDANRQREIEFLNNIVEFRGAHVLDVAYGEDTTMVIWRYDYTHKEWGVRNYTQVSVQNWKNGKIIKEQFFYGN